MAPLIITLDGPAGSGKSTVARALARRLGLEFLDTGAMYRSLTALCLDRGIDPAAQPDEAVELARANPMRFDWSQDPPRLYVGEQDVTHRIRDEDVTAAVSPLSAIPAVRSVLVEAQKRIGAEHRRLVTEGRDQGSVVFPDAPVKFFLEAEPRVRARRRAEQLRAAGKQADERLIYEQLIARDTRDASRADGPLICPDDAERIDTTPLSLELVVDLLEQRVREKAGRLLADEQSAAGDDG